MVTTTTILFVYGSHESPEKLKRVTKYKFYSEKSVYYTYL